MGMAADSQFHVLAVDDSLIDRKLIERLLKTSSYQVTTVDSGSKALEFLGLYEDDQTNPDSPSVSPNNQQEVEVNLIITDYCMPGMTGYDLLRKIKESSSLKNIPVVIMSSENVPSRINRCLEQGAEEFFLKPVRLSDLNRLRPHIIKTKSKDQNQEKPRTHEEEEASQKLETSSKKSQKLESSEVKQEQQELLHHQLQLQQSQPPNSNKRKTMEEGLSPDRTRPRYSGITTAV